MKKILWLADELALDYQHIPAGGDHGGLDSPEFLALNPGGRVPVIVDGKISIWKTHAILRYLAAQYGSRAFQRDTPAAQSCIDRWVNWSLSELEPAFFRGIFWGYYRTPEAQRDGRAIAQAMERCDRLYQRLDDQLRRQPWLSGERLGWPIFQRAQRYIAILKWTYRTRHYPVSETGIDAFKKGRPINAR